MFKRYSQFIHAVSVVSLRVKPQTKSLYRINGLQLWFPTFDGLWPPARLENWLQARSQEFAMGVGGCFGGWKQHQTVMTQVLICLHSD